MAPPTAGSGIDCLRRRVQNPLARRIVTEWPRPDIPTLPGSAGLGDTSRARHAPGYPSCIARAVGRKLAVIRAMRNYGRIWTQHLNDQALVRPLGEPLRLSQM